MKPFNHHQVGYDDGLNDAINDNRKGKNLKPIEEVPYVWASQSPNYSIYLKGYDDGYRDGMAKKNNVYR